MNDEDGLCVNSLHTDEELDKWIEECNKESCVNVKPIGLADCKMWFYDGSEGSIRNEKNVFFKIIGVQQREKDCDICEQPIIVQDEIGYLGIISCKINGVWHYLMQAKVEPGNVNGVQISPTLQATKSNFTRKHGGDKPLFLEYFVNCDTKDIIVDQIQSEQSSRFYKKRNIVIKVSSPIDETKTHKWMTLRQIKTLMRRDNMVNMDTRTVLACIPYVLLGQDGDIPFRNKTYFYRTAQNINRKTIVEIYNVINDVKMYSEKETLLCPLHSLKEWHFEERGFCYSDSFPFYIGFYDIKIRNREVASWCQPMITSEGRGLFGLFCCDDDGVMKFLVKVRNEIGCFDDIEIGPTVQMECTDVPQDKIEEIFLEKLDNKDRVVVDINLSEEGGRFYREENRNAIVFIEKNEIDNMNNGYIWSDYGTLNILTQVNNCLNIQLRNLLSLLFF